MDTVIGVVIIVAVIVVGVLLANRASKKRKAETWTGTVVKKWLASYSDEDGEVTKVPTIQVARSDGKTKKYAVSAATYNSLNEGDSVKKEAGSSDPVKA